MSGSVDGGSGKGTVSFKSPSTFTDLLKATPRIGSFVLPRQKCHCARKYMHTFHIYVAKTTIDAAPVGSCYSIFNYCHRCFLAYLLPCLLACLRICFIIERKINLSHNQKYETFHSTPSEAVRCNFSTELCNFMHCMFHDTYHSCRIRSTYKH